MQALAGRKDAECPKIQGPARAKLSKPDNRPSPVIPLWKIKRELTRLSVQARAIPLAFYEPFVQRRHDASRPTEITATKGTLAATSKLAIFLIYQPDGVASSVLTTCRHLIDNGFAPVVVSNAPLSDKDRENLSETACLVVERPNFGYDFGGYRDGWWVLDRQNLSPDHILFLNDSIWFPATQSATTLNDMTTSHADFVGLQAFGNLNATGRKRGFFASYCLLLKRPLIDHAAFKDFWASYRMSSNKEVTLRRGERAFSWAMFNTGLPAHALFSLEIYHDCIDTLPSSDLTQALADLVVVNPTLNERRNALVASSKDDAFEDAARVLLKDAARTKNYIGASPIVALTSLGLPVIKKNNEHLYVLAREKISEAHANGRLPDLHSEVAEELERKLRR